MFCVFSADQSSELADQQRGGGVCFLLNQRWSNVTKLVLEIFAINCKLFYSLLEFSFVVLLGVYVQPDASATKAVSQLAAHDHVVPQEAAHPLITQTRRRDCLGINNMYTLQYITARSWITVTQSLGGVSYILF